MKSFLWYFSVALLVDLFCKYAGIYDLLNAFLDDTVPAHIDAWSKWLHEAYEVSAPFILVCAGLLVPPVIYSVYRSAIGYGR